MDNWISGTGLALLGWARWQAEQHRQHQGKFRAVGKEAGIGQEYQIWVQTQENWDQPEKAIPGRLFIWEGTGMEEGVW